MQLAVAPLLLTFLLLGCGRGDPELPPAPVYRGAFSAKGRIAIGPLSGQVAVRRADGTLSLAVLTDGGPPVGSVRLRGGEVEQRFEDPELRRAMTVLVRGLALAWDPPAHDPGCRKGPWAVWCGDPRLPREIHGHGLTVVSRRYILFQGTLMATEVVIAGAIEATIRIKPPRAAETSARRPGPGAAPAPHRPAPPSLPSR